MTPTDGGRTCEGVTIRVADEVIMSRTKPRPADLRDRAVRLVLYAADRYLSLDVAIKPIAAKLGIGIAQTLPSWVPGISTSRRRLWGANDPAEALIWGYAAMSYSFVRPPRIFVRVIRWAGNGMTWGSSNGARRLSPRPWCERPAL